jgi:uncharacterized repeat protein (TIGR01451 family)
VGVALVAAPSVALAAPPDPSAASVSSSSVEQGETFTASVELFNPEDFTVHDANADLRVQGDTSIVDLFDLVSCTGSISLCSSRVTSFRGPVGDLDPGAGRTVEFTFRVRDNAVPGAYQLEHQFTGSDFAFEAGAGPALTVTGDPQFADLAVGLDASPRGILTSRITYTVAVTNNGPAAATGVRISGTYAAGLYWASGSGCVRVGSRGVQCDFASVPVGSTVRASFAANAGLLALGSFTTTVQRATSSPSDPNSGNDSARRSCAALTGLLVRC